MKPWVKASVITASVFLWLVLGQATALTIMPPAEVEVKEAQCVEEAIASNYTRWSTQDDIRRCRKRPIVRSLAVTLLWPAVVFVRVSRGAAYSITHDFVGV